MKSGLLLLLGLFLLYFALPTRAWGQEINVEKLIQQARMAKQEHKEKECITFYLQALSEMRKNETDKNKLTLAKTYTEIAEYFLSVKLSNKALEYLLEARKRLGEELKTPQEVEVNTLLAEAYFESQNYAQALELYEKLVNYHRFTTGNRRAMLSIMKRIYAIHHQNNNYNNAIATNLEMLTITRSLRDSIETATIYNNLGYTYKLQNKNEQAIQNFNESLKWRPNNPANEVEKQTTLNNIAIVEQSKGNFIKAINALQDLIRVQQKAQNNLEVSRLSNILSAVYLYRDYYEDAKIYAEKALNLATPFSTNNDNIDQKIEAYRQTEIAYDNLAKMHQAINEFQQASRFIQLKSDVAKVLLKLQDEKQQKVDELERQIIQTQISIADTTALREARKALEEQRKRSEAERQKAIADRQLAEAEARKVKAEAEAQRQRAETERQKAEAEKRQAETERQKAEAEKQNALAQKELLQKQADLAKAEAEKQRLEAEKQKSAAEKQRYEAEKKEAERKGQITQLILFAVLLGFILMIILAYVMYKARNQQKKANALLAQRNEEIEAQRDEIEAQRQLVEKERATSETLLRNILPEEVANELKVKGYATPRSYEMVTVLFTDFKGFTNITAEMTPVEVIKELDRVFMAFDNIINKHNLEKIKTIGDAYMCAGGIPVANQTNPFDAILAGLEIQEYMNEYKQQQIAKNEPYFQCRLGIHTGRVVAGVVGTKKFAYDIWGDAVNTASRMESSGEVELVNISGATYELIKDYFECEYRGKIPAKNKGDVDMYFVKKLIKLPEVMA